MDKKLATIGKEVYRYKGPASIKNERDRNKSTGVILSNPYQDDSGMWRIEVKFNDGNVRRVTLNQLREVELDG